MPFAYYQARGLGVPDPRFGAARVLSARVTERLETLTPGLEEIRKDSDFVPTPMGVVDLMMAEATVLKERESNPFPTRCLEPSAGSGRIARALLASENTEVDVVEIHPDRRRELAAAGMRLVGDDFLNFSPASATLARKRGYDCIMMNPPFSDAQYIQHLKHAQGMLRPGGNLVSIVPHYMFKNADNREWYMSLDSTKCTQLSRNHFKEQKVDIATHILTIREPKTPMVSAQSPSDYHQTRIDQLLASSGLGANDTPKTTLLVNDMIPDLPDAIPERHRRETTYISRNMPPRLDSKTRLGGNRILEHSAKHLYDRIVMTNFNEPERMMDELQFADGLLAPGGKIVLLAPEGLFERQDSRSEAFFKWLEAHRTFEITKLPKHRSFPDARIVVVDQPITEKLRRITSGNSGFFMVLPPTVNGKG